MLAHQRIDAAALALPQCGNDLAMVALRQDHDFAMLRGNLAGTRLAAKYRLRRRERQLVVQRQRPLQGAIAAGFDDQAMEASVHFRPEYVVVETVARLADDARALLQTSFEDSQHVG